MNMARHLRLVHSEYVCFWRCPVPSCSLWFTSELNEKDHIQNIHRFREGRGMSFYECLRFGLEAEAILMSGGRRASRFGWIWRSRVVLARSYGTITLSQRAQSSPITAVLRRRRRRPTPSSLRLTAGPVCTASVLLPHRDDACRRRGL